MLWLILLCCRSPSPQIGFQIGIGFFGEDWLPTMGLLLSILIRFHAGPSIISYATAIKSICNVCKMVIPKGAIHKVCYILHRGQQFQTHLYQFVFHLLATKMHICTTYLQWRAPKMETQPGANLCTTSLIPSHIAKPVSWVIFVWNWIWCIGQFLAQGWRKKKWE